LQQKITIFCVAENYDRRVPRLHANILELADSHFFGLKCRAPQVEKHNVRPRQYLLKLIAALSAIDTEMKSLSQRPRYGFT
jgi:hypothetical protein